MGSGNGLMPLANKPLPEAMLTQVYVTIWRHNVLTHGQKNGHHFTFLKAYSEWRPIIFWFRFHWNIFPRLRLAISQHNFRYWRGGEQATSHYLNQCWANLLMHIYVSLSLNELKLEEIWWYLIDWCTSDQQRWYGIIRIQRDIAKKICPILSLSLAPLGARISCGILMKSLWIPYWWVNAIKT